MKGNDKMIASKLYELMLPYPEKGLRLVRVFVPPHEDGETFPVIYMTDGQNLFDKKSSTWGCWHTMETVEDEMKNGLGGAVIVGIDNNNEWRDKELTPAQIGEIVVEEAMGHFAPGEGEIFDGFVMDIVKPYIEASFPVKKGRKYTAFCGSSSGGLQSFFTALAHKDSFSAAGVFSPAFLLYSEEDMRRWISEQLGGELPYLYIYTGAGDELERRIFKSTEAAYDALCELSYPYDLLNEVILFENKHHESAWEEVFRDFLHTFLFRCGED
jgi:alpha-glucosidase